MGVPGDVGRRSIKSIFHVLTEIVSIIARCSCLGDLKFQQTYAVAHLGGRLNMSDCSLDHLQISNTNHSPFPLLDIYTSPSPFTPK
jgi:hypothetical protein